MQKICLTKNNYLLNVMFRGTPRMFLRTRVKTVIYLLQLYNYVYRNILSASCRLQSVDATIQKSSLPIYVLYSKYEKELDELRNC